MIKTATLNTFVHCTSSFVFRTSYIVLCTLFLVSCGAKKAVVVVEPEVPAWHTCLIQGARVVVETDEDKISATANLQVVRDSMLVISVMPMLGIEMLRVEATPQQVIAIDKIHAQYTVATYSEVNGKLTPELTWTILQQLCSAELPTGDKKAILQYSYGKETLKLTIDYPERLTDVPVRVFNTRLDKYTKIDISKWL